MLNYICIDFFYTFVLITVKLFGNKGGNAI